MNFRPLIYTLSRRSKRNRMPASSPRATLIQRRPSHMRISPQAAALGTAAIVAGAVCAIHFAPFLASNPDSILAIGKAVGPPEPHGDDLRVVPSYPVDARFSLDRQNFILISKDAKRLTVYRKLREFNVATGMNDGDKQRVGDCRTPLTPPGTVYAVERKLLTPAASVFGPRFIGLSTPPWRGIAIHGTDDSASIGTNASHGCVRLANYDIRWLFDQVRIGDPVVIGR